MYLDIGEVTKSTRFLFLKYCCLGRSLTDTSSCVLSHAAHAVQVMLLKQIIYPQVTAAWLFVCFLLDL